MAIKRISTQAPKVIYVPFVGMLTASNDNTPPDLPPALALRAAA